MAIPVLPYIPSMGVKQTLVRQFQSNKLNDGYIIEDTIEVPFPRANGVGGISSYRGLNKFNIGYNKTLNGAGELADNLWIWFMARLDNLNEPFHFYNPTEHTPPDLTGTEPIGRYYVKLENPNQVLSRDLFRACLFSYELAFIECKDFNVSLGDEEDEEVEESGYIEIPIEIIDIGISPWAGGATFFHKTSFYYDPDKYDEVIDIQIEVVGEFRTAMSLNIVDYSNGAVCGHIELPVTGTHIVGWFRTNFNTSGDAFVPYESTGNRKYGIYVNSAHISNVIYTVRLIVRQLPTMTKTRIQFPLIHSFNGESSQGLLGLIPTYYAVHDWGNSTYHVPTLRGRTGYWQWNPTKFSADAINFDIEVCTCKIWSGMIYTSLFDVNGATKLSASEQFNNNSKGWTYFGQNSWLQKKSFGTGDITPYTNYELQVKNNPPNIIFAKLFHAAIYINLSGVDEDPIQFFEIYHRIAGRRTFSTSYKTDLCRAYTPKSRNNFVHEMCGTSTITNPPIPLGNDGENTIEPTSPEDIENSEIDLGAASSGIKTIERSANFSLSKGDMVVTPDLRSGSYNGDSVVNFLITPINIAQEKADMGL